MQEVRRGVLVALAVGVVDRVIVALELIGTAERGELIDAFDIDGLRRIGTKVPVMLPELSTSGPPVL